jgi:hypothetical protein
MTVTTLKRGLRTTLVAAGVAAFMASPAHAVNLNVAGGKTDLRLTKATAQALTGLGVTVSGTGRATAITGGLSFPVVAGTKINPATAAGRVNHVGGMRLRAGRTSVVLSDFRIQTLGTPRMFARVNGGAAYLPLLIPDLSKAKILRPGIATRVTGVQVKLSALGARSLNSAFGVTAFKPNMSIGSASVLVNTREVAFTGGATELAVPAATVNVLTGLGITPGITEGAEVTESGAFSFPITKGRAVVANLAGAIDHSGGLTFTKGATVVSLTDYRIDTRRAELWGKVNGSEPVALFKLDLSAPQIQTASRQLWIGNVKATLTAGAATALNGAFATTAFTEGIDFGTAQVKGQIA